MSIPISAEVVIDRHITCPLRFGHLQSPTGYPPRVWTEQEKSDLKTSLKTLAREESRDLSTVPNAHEFAGRPPPTPEQEASIDAALDKIFSKESKMEQATPTVDMNEVIQQSEEAANALLAQDGWNIVRQMHAATLDAINQTSLVVLPVMANLDEYKPKLTDAEGFEKRFATLSNDITQVMVTVKALSAKFDGKTGKPSVADLDLIGSLTMDYTRVQGHIEQAIQPLILILVDELEAVGITELNVEV